MADRRWRRLAGDGFERQQQAWERLGSLKDAQDRTRKQGGMLWSSQFANAVFVRVNAVV